MNQFIEKQLLLQIIFVQQISRYFKVEFYLIKSYIITLIWWSFPNGGWKVLADCVTGATPKMRSILFMFKLTEDKNMDFMWSLKYTFNSNFRLLKYPGTANWRKY